MIPKPNHKSTGKSRRGKVQRRMNAYRKEHPACERCGAGSTQVHHIIRVGMGGAPPDSPLHQEDNFMALCDKCHKWAEENYAESRVCFQKMKRGKA